MNIYSKPPYSKRYVSYLSDYLEPCFNNIPCCLVRRICMIVENGDVRHIILKELRTILKTQKYPQIVITKIKNRIEKVLAIPQEHFRTKKLKSNDDILPTRSQRIFSL